jgi:hypothetical protein
VLPATRTSPGTFRSDVVSWPPLFPNAHTPGRLRHRRQHSALRPDGGLVDGRLPGGRPVRGALPWRYILPPECASPAGRAPSQRSGVLGGIFAGSSNPPSLPCSPAPDGRLPCHRPVDLQTRRIPNDSCWHCRGALAQGWRWASRFPAALLGAGGRRCVHAPVRPGARGHGSPRRQALPPRACCSATRS